MVAVLGCSAGDADSGLIIFQGASECAKHWTGSQQSASENSSDLFLLAFISSCSFQCLTTSYTDACRTVDVALLFYPVLVLAPPKPTKLSLKSGHSSATSTEFAKHYLTYVRIQRTIIIHISTVYISASVSSSVSLYVSLSLSVSPSG